MTWYVLLDEAALLCQPANCNQYIPRSPAVNAPGIPISQTRRAALR
jgi:hypothetical protein